MLSTVLLLACNQGDTSHQSQPTIEPSPTSTRTVPEPHTIDSTPFDWPTATPTPSPTPTPTTTQAVQAQAPQPAPQPTYDNEAILELLRQYDWPLNEAIAVMMCESGGNPNAYNASGATGLFQIHPHRPEMFDPALNVQAAYAKYLDGVRTGNRWKHWNQYGSCGHFF